MAHAASLGKDHVELTLCIRLQVQLPQREKKPVLIEFHEYGSNKSFRAQVAHDLVRRSVRVHPEFLQQQ